MLRKALFFSILCSLSCAQDTPITQAYAAASVPSSNTTARPTKPIPVQPMSPPAQPIDDVCVSQETPCKAFAMDAFYQQLAETEAKEPGALTRIVHFGDSVITSDYITTSARRSLQTTFGDGGRGYVFAGLPKFYYLSDITHNASNLTFRSVNSPYSRDDRYGIGGEDFTGRAGASVRLRSPKEGAFGQKIASVKVYYLGQAEPGTVAISVDKKELQKISTKQSETKGMVATQEIAEGPHHIDVSVTQGMVRLFGIALESAGPGVVYDAVGLFGNNVYAMLRAEESFWKAQLALRAPHLVVVSLGANETGYVAESKKALEEYRESERRFLLRIREAVPTASCLVFGPIDGARPAFGPIREVQKTLAAELGCAFWDTQAYMGGKGSYKTWKKKGWLSSDAIHPSPQGGDKLGDAFAEAIIAGLAAYQQRTSH